MPSPLPVAGHPRDEPAEEADDGERAATERLVFFSDAVLAIALTLLAIELPLPAQGSSAQMWHEVQESWPGYLAFLISFAVIGAHWRLHHAVFHDVHRASRLLVRLDQNWLLMAVVTPFLTRLLSEGHLNVVRFVPYAVAQTVQFSLMAGMIAVIRRQGLTGDPRSADRLVGLSRRALSFAAAFALSVPVFLLVGAPAFALWGVLPLLGRVVRRQRERTGTAATR